MRNLWKLFGFVAALGLAMSIVAGTALADTSDTADITITLTDTGVFAVEIVDPLLDPLNVDAVTGGTSAGSLSLRYTDTKSYRIGFRTQLIATDFQSDTITTRPYQSDPGGDPYTIPASNLTITKNYNVFQGRWSSGSVGSGGPAIGDIGATVDGNYVGSSSGPYCCTETSGPLTGIQYHDWTSAANNSLETNSYVGFGFSGPGTAGTAISYGSLHVMTIQLVVPAGQPADTYTSTLTVTVTSEDIP